MGIVHKLHLMTFIQYASCMQYAIFGDERYSEDELPQDEVACKRSLKSVCGNKARRQGGAA